MERASTAADRRIDPAGNYRGCDPVGRPVRGDGQPWPEQADGGLGNRRAGNAGRRFHAAGLDRRTDRSDVDEPAARQVTFRASVLTLYPEIFPGPLGASLAGK